MRLAVFLYALSIGAFCLPSHSNSAAGPAGDRFVVFEANGISAELALYIAEVGQPKIEALSSQTDLLAAIAERCGKINAAGTYLGIFAAANAELEAVQDRTLTLRDDANVVFPACAYAEAPAVSVSVTNNGPEWAKCNAGSIPPGSKVCTNLPLPDLMKLEGNTDIAATWPSGLPPTLGIEAITTMSAGRLADPGVGGAVNQMLAAGVQLRSSSDIVLDYDNRMSASPRSAIELTPRRLIQQFLDQDIILANQYADFRRLAKDVEVARPGNFAGITGFQLASGFDPETAAEEVSRRSGNDNVSVIANPQAILSVESQCPEAGPPGSWPYALDDLERALKLSAALKNSKYSPGPVLIVDTGFPPTAISVSPFSIRYFAEDTFTTQSIKAYPDISIFRPFRYIIDLVKHAGGNPTRRSVPFYSDTKDGDHGLAVATMALGGVGFLNRLDPSTNGERHAVVVPAVAYDVDQGRIRAVMRALNRALSGDGWRSLPIRVVNMSFSYHQSYGTETSSFMSKNRGTLYVAAAGNIKTGGQDLALLQTLPATFGGRAQPNVITVTSVDSDGRKSAFANFSTEYVDIAAPGCNVPTYRWDAKDGLKVDHSAGTSLAAPLVSFVASLIANELGNPEKVKRRISASADYTPALDEFVSSGGRLNPSKAVAVGLDVVETTDGDLRFGRIAWPARRLVCNTLLAPAGQIEDGRLLKLTRLPESTGTSHVLRLNLRAINSWMVDYVNRCTSDEAIDDIKSIKMDEVVQQADGPVVSTVTINLSEIKDITFCEPGKCKQLN